MNLENILLSEGSQTQRPHTVRFHLYECQEENQSRWKVDEGGLGAGEMGGVVAKGCQVKKHPDGGCVGSPSPWQASGLKAGCPPLPVPDTQYLSPYTLFIFHNSLPFVWLQLPAQ